MSFGKTLGVVLLSILLTTAIFGATVTTAAERTAFDGEYVSETFEEEGVYAEITTELRGDVKGDLTRGVDDQPLPNGITVSLDGEQVAEQAVTEEFVASEMGKNIKELYAFLRGEDETLELVTNLEEVKESIKAEIVRSTEIDTAKAVGGNSERLDEQRISRLSDGEQEYQDAQIDLPDEERAEIEDELETNAKRQLGGDSEELTAAVLDHQATVLDGLTGEISYDEYVEQLEADEQRIKVAIADFALAGLPDEESLFGEGTDPESEFAPFATGIQWGVTLAWVLPLLALGLIGVVYGVTRSIDRTATITGSSLFSAGLVGVIFGFLIGPAVKSITGLGGGDPEPVIEGLIAVFDGTLRTIGLQSLVIAILGGVLFAIVLADRRGKLEQVRETLGLESRA